MRTCVTSIFDFPPKLVKVDTLIISIIIITNLKLYYITQYIYIIYLSLACIYIIIILYPHTSLSTPTVEPCGRTTYSRQSGIITSPHYPLPYPAELQCHYTIQVRTGHYVVLSIEELDLPTEDSQCQHGDRIIVKRTLEGQPSEALFVMCGSQRFRPIFISDSTLQQVTLKFSSDCNSSKRKSEGTFKLRFEQIPAFD